MKDVSADTDVHGLNSVQRKFQTHTTHKPLYHMASSHVAHANNTCTLHCAAHCALALHVAQQLTTVPPRGRTGHSYFFCCC
jgi:hypothetical protein